MLTVVINNENSRTISIPAEELEKIGISEGEEVEFAMENDAIILRPTQSDRKRRIINATRAIIENRKSALIELGKGHE